jgi:hypothetical protein
MILNFDPRHRMRHYIQKHIFRCKLDVFWRSVLTHRIKSHGMTVPSSHVAKMLCSDRAIRGMKLKRSHLHFAYRCVQCHVELMAHFIHHSPAKHGLGCVVCLKNSQNPSGFLCISLCMSHSRVAWVCPCCCASFAHKRPRQSLHRPACPARSP